jgi:hypothetical protein
MYPRIHAASMNMKGHSCDISPGSNCGRITAQHPPSNYII